MTPPEHESERHTRAAIERLSTLELYDLENELREKQLTLGNGALLEALKSGVWIQWAGSLAAGIAGLMLSPFLDHWQRVAIAGGLLLGSVIGFAGALWHRKRGFAHLGAGKAMEPMREMLGREIERRGRVEPEVPPSRS